MNAQLELAFSPAKLNPSVRATAPRGSAGWWFKRMRTVVDRAMAWQPASDRPRPEQTYLSSVFPQSSAS